MKIINGNIWDIEANYKVIPINGVVKKNGRLVMGKGLALEANIRYPDVDLKLGALIKEYGLRVYIIGNIFYFPTKYHWKNMSNPLLIRNSCENLVKILEGEKNIKVLIPLIGCGNGGLKWENVEKMISSYFDDRFYVVINSD